MKTAVIQFDGLLADLKPMWDLAHIGPDFEYKSANPIKRGWIWSRLEAETECSPHYNEDAVIFCETLCNMGYRLFGITHIESQHADILQKKMPKGLRDALHIVHVANRDVGGTFSTEGILYPDRAIVYDDEDIKELAGANGSAIFIVNHEQLESDTAHHIFLNEPVDAAWRVATTERKKLHAFVEEVLGEKK
ncbi:hypothetical protein [Acidithiobacillus thiooxidans]|uniref:hypothetical protein n=1 Tax=Acidithiobacillus thiooxidans TaxID=930 RepID=UPI0004E1EFDB|nr:hypothetical protein [Acidithiobacillus thiooxidans]